VYKVECLFPFGSNFDENNNKDNNSG